ncbi:hypothetical protein Fmac_031842 [Flemingia macrophylla]|uniref:Uncharacterized protein n=1 Tax=Flemingia macrophylla TaxID=520843 RepID=A0ABD1L375_9FABA
MLTTCVIQPIDMIKVRIQLGQGSAAQVTTTMLKNEGVAAFYKDKRLVLTMEDLSKALRETFKFLDVTKLEKSR